MTKTNFTFSADFLKCGYLKISRSALRCLFTPGDACHREARVLLCLYSLAYWGDAQVLTGGRKVQVQRGEWLGSYAELTARLGYSHGTIRKFLSRLSQQGWITVRREGNGIRCLLHYYDAPPQTTKSGYAQHPKASGQPLSGVSMEEAFLQYALGHVHSADCSKTGKEANR